MHLYGKTFNLFICIDTKKVFPPITSVLNISHSIFSRGDLLTSTHTNLVRFR